MTQRSGPPSTRPMRATWAWSCSVGAVCWRCATALGETDVLVAVPHDRSARVLELQLLVLHCLCDAVDLQLMGEQDPL